MSNYLSKSYQIQAPTDYSSLEVGAKVAYAMQTEYTQNKSIIDQTLASYNSQLRGLRDTDNEYMAAKLKEVKSAIELNSQKNGDLSKSYNKDSILSAITSVMDDPIVQDAVISFQNSKNLETQYKELFKKDPNLVNAGNYQDAKDQAGYSDYMSGKSKVLGKMELTPYTDVQKELNDRVSKWAKDSGYHTVVNSVNKGLYYEKTKGVYLTKNEILNFIKVNVDPTMERQMQINARQSYGKMQENDFNSLAKTYLNDDIKQDTDNLVKQKVILKTKHGQEAEDIRTSISQLELNILENQKSVEANKFDKNLQYTLYKKNLYGGLAEAYDKADIIDIDYDTSIAAMELNIKKFEVDTQFKQKELEFREKELQLESYKLDKKDSKGRYLDTGTAIPVIPEKDEEAQKSTETIIKENFDQTNANLYKVLSRDDPEFKKLKTPEQRRKHVVELMQSGSTVNPGASSPITLAMSNAIIAHKNNFKVYSDYSTKIKSSVDEIASDQYNDMLGAANLNLNNLGTTMPHTAQFLKEKRNFSKLSAEQQDIVKYERAIGALQFDDSLKKNERDALVTYTSSIKAKYRNDKSFQKSIELLGNDKELGYIENMTERYKAAAYNVIGAPINAVVSNLSYLPNKWIYGADYAEQQFKTWTDADKNWQTRRANSQKNLDKISSDYLGGQDTNITEVDSAEDSKTGTDFSKRLRSSLSDNLTSFDKNAKNYFENVENKQSFSFSTQDKQQESTALMLSQIVQNQKDEEGNPIEALPEMTKNNFNLEYFASKRAYRIGYINSKGVQTKTQFIDENLMPSSVTDMYGKSSEQWATSTKNRNATLPELVYQRPKDYETKKATFKNFVKIVGDTFTPLQLQEIDGRVGETPEVKVQQYVKKYPNIANNKGVIQGLYNIFNSEITISNQSLGESGFKLFPIVKYPNGKKDYYDSNARGLTTSVPYYDAMTNFNLQLTMVGDTQTQLAEEFIPENLKK